MIECILLAGELFLQTDQSQLFSVDAIVSVETGRWASVVIRSEGPHTFMFSDITHEHVVEVLESCPETSE